MSQQAGSSKRSPRLWVNPRRPLPSSIGVVTLSATKGGRPGRTGPGYSLYCLEGEFRETRRSDATWSDSDPRIFTHHHNMQFRLVYLPMSGTGRGPSVGARKCTILH